LVSTEEKNSKEFAVLFARVLAGNGITAIVSDRVTPTPVLSFAVKHGGYAAGVMITASHNPAVYNGVKFKGSYGGPFLTKDTAAVEALLNYNLVQISDNYKTENLLEDYFTEILERLNFKSARKKGLKLLIDSMGGAGGTVLEELLSRQKIESKTIFGAPDPQFNGRSPEPIDKNLKPLKEEILKGDYAFGIATDGDADRVAFVLDNGEWLSAQETILLFTDYLSSSELLEGDVVKTVSVTNKIYSVVSPNRKVRETQVGFKYITEEMLSGGVAMGFEESGGFGIAEHIPERDGLLFALIMLEMLSESPYTKLSELVAEKRKKWGKVFYDRIDHHYDQPDRMKLISKLFTKLPKKMSGFKVDKSFGFMNAKGGTNGIKMTFEGNSRWLLIRGSETEPLLRFYAEGDSAEEPEQLLKAGFKLLMKYRGS
jgi:Phosphomannomutase